MKFEDCSVCGTPADAPCPTCGSTSTYPVYAGKPQLGFDPGTPVGAKRAPRPVESGHDWNMCGPANGRIPDYVCPNCKTGFEVGRIDTRTFHSTTEVDHVASHMSTGTWVLDGHPDTNTETPDIPPVTDNPDAQQLIDDLRQLVTDKANRKIVVDELTLSSIDLGPTTDPWWWRGLRLWTVCSQTCFDKAFGKIPTSRHDTRPRWPVGLSIWTLSQPGEWVKTTGPQPNRSNVWMAHVSTHTDRIGAWIVSSPTDGIHPVNEEHVGDPRILDFLDIAPKPPVPEEWESFNIRNESEPGMFRTKVIYVEVHLVVEGQRVRFGQVEQEVVELYGGDIAVDVNLPDWMVDKAKTGADEAFARQLAGLVSATVTARLAPWIITSEQDEDTLMLAHDSIKAVIKLRDQYAGGLVWGVSHRGPVYLRRTDAVKWAQTWQAVKTSTTWGVLRHRLPPTQVEWITDIVESSGWDDDPVTDLTDISGFQYAFEGDSSYWPWLANWDHQQKALSGLSADVDAVLDDEELELSFTPMGEYLEYRNGERIAKAIRADGIPCDKNDQLITQALGPYG